jgi:hypothetical protein
MSELIPGVSVSSVLRPTGHDVNGVADNRGASTIHGGRTADYQLQLDGAQMDQGGGATGQAWQANPAEVQNYVYETVAISAEAMGGGVRANVIPKEGGNRYTAYIFYSYTNKNLQSDNLSQSLKDLGATVNHVLRHYDVNLATGVPSNATGCGSSRPRATGEDKTRSPECLRRSILDPLFSIRRGRSRQRRCEPAGDYGTSECGLRCPRHMASDPAE